VLHVRALEFDTVLAPLLLAHPTCRNDLGTPLPGLRDFGKRTDHPAYFVRSTPYKDMHDVELDDELTHACLRSVIEHKDHSRAAEEYSVVGVR